MMNVLFTAPSATNGAMRKWSFSGLFRALLLTRHEIRRIDIEAERERLQMGYARIPQRVWARRSALFIDR